MLFRRIHLFYIDGSQDGHFYTFTALGVPDTAWKEFYLAVAGFRSYLRTQHGIKIRKELHATYFLSGRGRPSHIHLSLQRRSEIFMQCMEFVASLRQYGALLFNAALGNQQWAFERLLNRINRTMQADVRNDRAMLICDEGNEWEYIKLVRKMGLAKRRRTSRSIASSRTRCSSNRIDRRSSSSSTSADMRCFGMNGSCRQKTRLGSTKLFRF